MGKHSFVMALVLVAAAASILTLATIGTVAAGPEARLAEAAKGQALPEPADGGGLARKARSLLRALKAGDEIALYDSLAPWQQEAEALKQQRVLWKAKQDKNAWNAFALRLKRLKVDPKNKFKLESAAALKALSPPQYSALMAGVYRAQADPEASARLNARWYVISVETGLVSSQSGGEVWYVISAENDLVRMQRRGELEVMTSGGVATLENVQGDTLTVRGVRSGSAWRVLSYYVRVGKSRIRLVEGADGGATVSRAEEARAGEAKAALGMIKDRVRVYYVQNNNELAGNNTITDYIPQAAIELTGEYYSASDYHINDQDLTAVKLTADGDAASGRPKVEFTFNASTGKSDGGFVVTSD